MSEEYIPRPYQAFAIDKVIDNDAVALMLDMGLGKTSIVLTAIQRLERTLEIEKPLVIAPKKVAESTWDAECRRWKHLEHMRCSKILGPAAQRKKALSTDADLYIINRENIPWLADYYGSDWPFDMVIIDESSSFKSPRAQRFKALKKIRPLVSKIVELTGTPAPNGLMDLWSQIYLLDKGKRLGKSMTKYQQTYFKPAFGSGYITYKWTALPGAKDRIQNLISDICFSMKSEDYLSLPDIVYNEVPVTLPEAIQKRYNSFERDCVMELSNTEITALSAAACSTKLAQMANGFVYTEDKEVISVHDEKLTALKEIAEANEGKSLLVFYWFNADRDRLLQAFPKARELKTPEDIEAWNQGKVSIMLAHPASAGHGLNLQFGGHIIVWFGLTWSLELYQQANKRLHRSGQTEAVVIHHLIAQGTIDEAIMSALKTKEQGQEALLKAIKARLVEHKGGTKSHG